MKAWRLDGPVVILLLMAASSGAQDQAAVAPGPEFKDSGWHKLWFGEGYRQLWATPARVPVLYLGDLTPVQQVGQLQTAGLAFEASGRPEVLVPLASQGAGPRPAHGVAPGLDVPARPRPDRHARTPPPR